MTAVEEAVSPSLELGDTEYSDSQFVVNCILWGGLFFPFFSKKQLENSKKLAFLEMFIYYFY